MTERLFTPRFFVMCGFSFTVFLSAFQLFPTAPFHILALGGSTFASGLFLGILTYASAFSAPLTGALVDRAGAREVLVVASVAITAFSIAYAVIPDYRIMLGLVVVHGIFWSGLLTGSGAYITNILPEQRRAEGLAYWGLSTIAAIAVAPPIGFWVFRFGWRVMCLEAAALNVAMACIAWTLPPQSRERSEPAERRASERVGGSGGAKPPGRLIERSEPAERRASERVGGSGGAKPPGRLIEWKVLVLSFTLFLYSFGYGGVTSFTALYADANGVHPKGIFLTTLALAILVTRPMSGRLGDRFGYRRILLPSLVIVAIGLSILIFGGTKVHLIASAIIYGAGFGTAYPVFVSYVLRHVTRERRGAAFGAILACFDTGIGTGSTTMGWIIGAYGFPAAFGTGTVLCTLSVPYFLIADPLLRRATGSHSDHSDHKVR
ncbi:MAG TPA: MFS transporter [Vicinamibacterales bacterium]|nr:MFS transporter [Vicinamibacterales bacterium]